MRQKKRCGECRALYHRFLSGYACGLGYEVEEAIVRPVPGHKHYEPRPAEPCPRPLTYAAYDKAERKPK